MRDDEADMPTTPGNEGRASDVVILPPHPIASHEHGGTRLATACGLDAHDPAHQPTSANWPCTPSSLNWAASAANRARYRATPEGSSAVTVHPC